MSEAMSTGEATPVKEKEDAIASVTRFKGLYELFAFMRSSRFFPRKNRKCANLAIR